MKCPKCNSENTQIQTKENKPHFMLAFALAIGGLGLLFLGIIGLLLGSLLGVFVGAVINAFYTPRPHSILVCQSCGYVSNPIAQPNGQQLFHPLSCPPEQSNLDVIRNDVVKGTIVIIRAKIDEYAPFDMHDNSTMTLKVEEGTHLVSYEQINGIGKKNNRGQLRVDVSGKTTVMISFTRHGLIVREVGQDELG